MTRRRHPLTRSVTKTVQWLSLGITVFAAFVTPVVAQPPGLVVSVAVSVSDALDEIAGLYRAATGVTIALNTGGSNTLARQIIEGARAGLFLSADDIQMNLVEKAGRIVPGTRTRLLTNELALVAPASASSFTLA
ncbi:MAG TPA: molybdate ABC transporter substrate-binding protein, partial [Vicinamibacterales bacterium]|nr:molybdate ABC transporter substrate-binding protein [Vicinamibacterales bacterium]